MSKKRDMVWDGYYAPHLNGGRANNPVNNKQASTEHMYMRILTEMCANRFEWKGMPESVNIRSMELWLTYTALAVFYRDRDSGELLVVRGSGAGHMNFLDEPISFNVIGPNMQAKMLSAVQTRDKSEKAVPAQCVPIWANYLRIPDLDVIRLYSHKLAKVDRSIEITMDNMRKSKVVNAPQDQRLSFINILKEIAEGQETVFGTNALNMEQVSVLDLGVDPLTLPNLQIGRSKLWSECMGMLGINNANQEKKERLVAAEVGANDEQVQATRNIALNARQMACEQINKLFGTSISVEFKAPPAPPADETPGKGNDDKKKDGDK